MNDKQIENITSRDVDFAKWYTDVIRQADLIDYSSVKGSMIIRPYGYAIWEAMVNVLDNMFKQTNHENIQMPLFIPESLLNIEKEHVLGFAPEVAWVTHGGKDQLEERMCVRPTSEVLFCEHYKKIIKSYRDLPKLYNQWCTIVRWEKTTRPFLRSREILWQEGHTMHETSEEAINETLRMLKIYETFQREYLAIPVITGQKTDKEKFAGAVLTYTVEAMMYDGVALQNGTSHYFGDHFAKAFGIQYLDQNNEMKTPFQTSWGVSTRMIGGLIMVHSDDHGLVLPPKIAPTKVIIIPIGNYDQVLDQAFILSQTLKDNQISCIVDTSDKTPGYKFASSEVKGYPIRIEIGMRDLSNNCLTLVRRDTLEKTIISLDSDLVSEVNKLLTSIQDDMYNRALKRRDSMIYTASNYDEFISHSQKPGFIKTKWCGNASCEDKIKADTGLKSRCIIDEKLDDGQCVCCSKKAKYNIYFGKQY